MTVARLRIAIVGDGLLPSLAAVTLAHALGDGRSVTMVGTGRGLPGLGPTGPAVVALPDWIRSPAVAALPLDRIVADTGAGFSLGIAFAGWSGRDDAWFLPFGDIGAPMGGVAFHQLAARTRAQGGAVRLADYSLGAMAAQSGRFAFPADDPRSPLSSLGFGQHFPVDRLAAVLQGVAEHAGVGIAAAPFVHAARDGDGIAALTLADGASVVADLYLDCTGPAALLIGEALEAPFVSWRHWLPCDRLVSRIEPAPTAPFAYAVHAAHASGWRATVPMAGGTAIVEHLASAMHGAPPDGATAFESGLRHEAWRGNCVAIGAAAALVEPVLGTPLLAAQASLDRLARLLPAASSRGVEATEFNRIAVNQAERLRDMAMALHATNRRIRDPLWDRLRAAHIPDTLARKLDLYASRGAMPMYDDELFDAAHWIAMLDGQGLRQRRIDPLAAAIPDAAVGAHFARLRERLLAALGTMKPHGEMLAALRSAG